MTPLEIPKSAPIPEGAKVIMETKDSYFVVPAETPDFDYIEAAED